MDFLLRLCSLTDLGNKLTLANGISSSAGALPTSKSLQLKGNLANFAFGQGEFLASPLQIASVYHALATGNVIAPKLILGFTNNMGLMTKEPDNPPIKVLSDSAVIKLRKMLTKAAESNGCDLTLFKVAGKTGTAQSGTFHQNKEILRTWFAGFFPADNPNYIVVVLNENGSSGFTDCSPVFREIAQKIVLR